MNKVVKMEIVPTQQTKKEVIGELLSIGFAMFVWPWVLVAVIYWFLQLFTSVTLDILKIFS